ncbi:MAG TPA: restriction endonuclease subunit S [Rhodanobacteraceae bacterium]|jgi:type I restriction enzyme S subunit|nr:restriction endonuclease subunit S [Rhodanobacteraceae bacterium]
MSEALERRLGEICELKNGFAFDSERFVETGGFPLIRIRDLKTNTPGLGYKGSFDNEYVMEPGALLISMDGEFRCFEWQGPPALLNQRVCELIPDPNEVDRDYLKFWIGRELARIEAETSFTTVKHLSSRDIQRLPVQFPPVHEQRARAAHVKGCLQEVQHGSNALISQVALADALFRQVLKEAFFYGLPIAARSQFSSLAVGWHWYPLSSLAKLESGHTPSRRHPEWWGGDVPWLALPDIRKLHGKVAHATCENTNHLGLANSSARLLPVNTVCVSRTASIGFVTLLGQPMATSQDFCNWICDPNKLDAEFLMYAFMASQDSMRDLGSGAVHKTIYMPTIESFHICAPSLDEQRRIARRLRDRLAAAETLQTRLRDRLTEIEQLPQRILAAAFANP